jgi:RNA polymerase sigma-70 factor (ECF subfamily)
MATDTWQRIAPRSWDEAEFEALFQAHYDGIYRLLYRIVGTQEEAEDLAQETFLRLYRQRFPKGRKHNVRAWLYRVATNLAYNALRGRARRKRRQETIARQEQAVKEQVFDPVEAAVRSEERQAVHRALLSLAPRKAKTLLLYYAGLSYRELAEALNIASGSVGTLLARAKKDFAAAYQVTVSEERRIP